MSRLIVCIVLIMLMEFVLKVKKNPIYQEKETINKTRAESKVLIRQHH